MLIKKNNYYLDHIINENKTYKIILPIEDGLVIKKKCNDEFVKIASIFYSNELNNCYIVTEADNLQNYVISYEEYLDFIYLVDEAFNYILTVNDTSNFINNN